MIPPAPSVVKSNMPDIIICDLCGDQIAGQIQATKHLRACHDFGLQEAIDKARVLLGSDSLRARKTPNYESI